MASGKKHSLPLVAPMPSPPKGASATRPVGPPSVDVARRNLGGRASTNAEAGRIVSLDGQGGVTAIGVVLFASETEVDVWLDEGIVRRTQPSQAQPFHGVVSNELVKLAGDAHVFGLLREGQRVRYDAQGVVTEGAIVEKCRYGALILREDGKLLAIGFRKLWPLVSSEGSSN